MSILESFEESFKMIIKNPKILLPATLNWFTLAVLLVSFIVFFKFLDNEIEIYKRIKDFIINGDVEKIEILTNPLFLKKYSFHLLIFINWLFLIILLHMLIDLYISSFYTHSFIRLKKKKFDLEITLREAIKSVPPLLWTWFVLVTLTGILVLILLIPVLFSAFLLLIFSPLIFVCFVFFFFCIWILPSVIIYKNLKGVEAIKFSLKFVYINFFKLAGVLILFLIVRIAVSASVSSMPIVGHFVYLLFDLFFIALDKMLQASVCLKLFK